MSLERKYWPVASVYVLSLVFFSWLLISQGNQEFILYLLVILFFGWVVLRTRNSANYPMYVLWGLTLWEIMHMAGGSVRVAEGVLYSKMLWPIIGEPYNILKYDQVVHVFGFFIATLVMFYLLKPKLKKNQGWVAVSIIVVMAGLGLGALNEIIEFMNTVFLPFTNVGGYENTSLDLVADLIGALLAMAWLYWKEK